MPGFFDAAYRVFVHNPPHMSAAGGPAVRYQRGPLRSGTQEWRTNTFETAQNKANKIARAEDEDNKIRVNGWVSIQKNLDGEWKTIAVIPQVGSEIVGKPGHQGGLE